MNLDAAVASCPIGSRMRARISPISLAVNSRATPLTVAVIESRSDGLVPPLYVPRPLMSGFESVTGSPVTAWAIGSMSRSIPCIADRWTAW